jgi:nicotinamidase-related amidase
MHSQHEASDRSARKGRVLIVGDACTHTPDDPEFERFPPHCIRGTPGADIIPETRADKVLSIPNCPDAAVPQDLSEYQQIILEKQTLDVFDNPNTEAVLKHIARFTDTDAEFTVFGLRQEGS